ncbi:hypothetical protein, partial [Rhizobium straminoryzae]|uniref:hypothetical protein n=1 Tax=Rhizobium straminoryzae TaxID=1387186 RepID=UPI001AEE05DE
IQLSKNRPQKQSINHRAKTETPAHINHSANVVITKPGKPSSKTANPPEQETPSPAAPPPSLMNRLIRATRTSVNCLFHKKTEKVTNHWNLTDL